MCGILVYSGSALGAGGELELLRQDIAARGPTHWGSVVAGGARFEASVLALRDPVTPQPVVEAGPHGRPDAVICFNGQIYDLPHGETQDTRFFCEQLRGGGAAAVLALEGEFAFAFYDGEARRISFGRDALGRRSLLYKLTDSGDVVISSVAGESGGFVECEARNTYYTYSLESRTLETHRVADRPSFRICRAVSEPLCAPELVLARLRTAVQKRLVRLRSMNQDPVAVLFSGGLDCTLIAALLGDLLPAGTAIHLLNVAFENKRKGTLWDTPDRLLGRRSCLELAARSPQREFRLVEINVPYSRTLEHTSKVRRLMAPNATVIDLSIALAFYFAAEPQDELGRNSAVLFSGLGADELFAGYSRHLRCAADAERLAAELEGDFERLPHRNLGRDDRVCASWGREVRYPFLDSDIVACAAGTPLGQKTDGTVTKIVLRDAARALGLGAVCDEKKRAIQFGARSAKMDVGSGSLKGHNAL